MSTVSTMSNMSALFQNSTFGPTTECGQIQTPGQICKPQGQRLLYSGEQLGQSPRLLSI